MEYKKLFQPIRINGLTIKNRTVTDRVTAGPAWRFACCRERIRVGIVSDGLGRDLVEKMKFDYFSTVGDAVSALIKRHGPDTQISVIPAAGEVYTYVTGN